MQFILTGFTQDKGFRVFAFEGIALDRIRTAFTVRADLALIRIYGIKVQELPLLCRSLLERSEDGKETHTMTFTEEEMRLHANTCAAARDAAAQKRKPPRQPSDETSELLGELHSSSTTVPVLPARQGTHSRDDEQGIISTRKV
jgi:hypothetical protein